MDKYTRSIPIQADMIGFLPLLVLYHVSRSIPIQADMIKYYDILHRAIEDSQHIHTSRYDRRLCRTA